MDNIAKKVLFSGHVQGVGFRFTVMNIACRCELVGQVRNCPDGSVEMIAQGHPEDVADCIRDIGESFEGHIRDIQEKEIPVDPSLTEFKITF